tara:strand:+ start:152 stop:469 length:318 start_codon:yes stop_codon:yes gene_type:complete
MYISILTLQGIKMKNIFLSILPILSLITFADGYEIKEGYAISGKISSVKTSSKYTSVEKCMSFATKREGIVAFTFDSKKDKCTIYKTVRSIKEDSSSTSGMIEES